MEQLHPYLFAIHILLMVKQMCLNAYSLRIVKCRSDTDIGYRVVLIAIRNKLRCIHSVWGKQLFRGRIYIDGRKPHLLSKMSAFLNLAHYHIRITQKDIDILHVSKLDFSADPCTAYFPLFIFFLFHNMNLVVVQLLCCHKDIAVPAPVLSEMPVCSYNHMCSVKIAKNNLLDKLKRLH